MQTTVTQLTHWERMIRDLRNIKPGQTHVYHMGMLCNDRDASLFKGDPIEYERAKVVDRVALVAWELHRRKKVFLTQRRVGNGTYTYRATGL